MNIERTPVTADEWKEHEGTYTDGVFRFGFITKGDKAFFIDEGQLYPCFPVTSYLFYAGEYGLLEFSKQGNAQIMTIQGAWHYTHVNEQ